MGAIQNSVNGIISSVGQLASIQARDKIIAEQSTKQTQLQTQLTDLEKKAAGEKLKSDTLDALAHHADEANEVARIGRERARRKGVGEASILVNEVNTAKNEDFVRKAGYTPESFEKAMWANKDPEDVYSSIDKLRDEYYRDLYLRQHMNQLMAEGKVSITQAMKLEGDN